MITIDNMASRYHMLPSEALEKATTFDLKVLDVSARWTNKKYQEQETGQSKSTQLSVDQMKNMMDQVRKKNETNSQKN